MHGHSKKSYIANDDKQKESWYEMKYERFIGKHYRITLIFVLGLLVDGVRVS
jgi:hypothetical protein